MSITQEPASLLPAEAVYYPESDGKPMAETDVHRDLMIYFIEALEEYFRGQQVYVSGNILLYYVEGDNSQSVSPDCLVAFGLAPGDRRVYKTWQEGKAPDLVVEVTSLSTRSEDRGRKRELYARLGVQEMWQVDPLGEYLGAPFRGYRLEAGAWVEIPVVHQRARSQILGLDLCLGQEGVRLQNPATGEFLPTAQELAAHLRNANENFQEAIGQLQSANENLQGAIGQLQEKEAQVRRQEEELEALRAELARLRSQDAP